MKRHIARQRKPEKLPPDWQGKFDFHLDSTESITYDTPTEANSVVAPSASSQSSEVSTTMTMSDTTKPESSLSNLEIPDSSTPVRKTYPQDWPAYNAAQTSEKDNLMVLLHDLCAGVEQPEYGFGRPRLPLADMVYTGALKVYEGFSARRFASDVRGAHDQGFIDVAPSFNTVNRYIANPELTSILEELIQKSAAPLSAVEYQFAADASGFSTSRFDRWYDAKWGKEKSQRHWLKAHIMTGTKTNIVTAIAITPSNIHDSPMFPKLLDDTAKNFTMAEVSADKAYLSDANLRHVERKGAAPYIPFKSNTTGRGSGMWKRLYAHFILNEDDFMEHYHRRSNVETTFSMVKSKFGDALRSKSDTGQVNEILLKFLCHNICVLIQEMHELGITPNLEPRVDLEISRN